MTGLIYLVIIALWAAVLIPMWLRRHDQISEVRSTARFSSAMRSLGSQGQPQYALSMSSGSLASGGAGVPMTRSNGLSRPPVESTYQREAARRAAATRRSIVLGILTGILLITLLAAVADLLPKWVPALAAMPVVAFVIASAMTASQRSASRPVRRRIESDIAPVMDSEPVPQTDEEWENWNAWDDDDSWEAVPTTLPTYVNAPRASAVPRGIDKATPGEWTGSAMVETAQAMRSRPASQPMASASSIDHGAETTEIPVVREDYDARRAVNE